MRKLKSFSAITLFLILTSCSVAVPDTPICAEISPAAGYCVNTISSTEFRVDESHPYEGRTWWELRPSMIMMPAPSWAKLKAFVIKVCRKTGKCDVELGNWERTIQKIDQQVTETEIGGLLE